MYPFSTSSVVQVSFLQSKNGQREVKRFTQSQTENKKAVITRNGEGIARGGNKIIILIFIFMNCYSVPFIMPIEALI